MRADDVLFYALLVYAIIVTLLAARGLAFMRETRAHGSCDPPRDARGRFAKRHF